MEKYSMTNEVYSKWTTKDIKDDFPRMDYVEITILDDDKLNMVGLTEEEWLNECRVAHGKEDVAFFDEISACKSMHELRSEIITAGAVKF